MALGTSASASTTRARISWTAAFISCSWATAMARRSSARAWAMRRSASAWSICSCAPMLRPTSTSAMSMERISKAVPASKPLLSTVRLMESGFSSTCLWFSLEPTVVTMPSPTRAMTVSSPAPPTRRSMLVRTVTRALARSSMPSLAMAATTGVSMTLGVTLICTAWSTSRPARSMAEAFSKGISMLERWAAIKALMTRSTLPPAR